MSGRIRLLKYCYWWLEIFSTERKPGDQPSLELKQWKHEYLTAVITSVHLTWSGFLSIILAHVKTANERRRSICTWYASTAWALCLQDSHLLEIIGITDTTEKTVLLRCFASRHRACDSRESTHHSVTYRWVSCAIKLILQLE